MAYEETTLGYRKPDGSDPAKNGDNHIAHNAQKNQEHIAALTAALAQANARLGVAEANIRGGLGTDLGLSEDPLNPGTYFMADTSPITEDPANPGLYTF
jgi:hypothetical protein